MNENENKPKTRVKKKGSLIKAGFFLLAVGAVAIAAEYINKTKFNKTGYFLGVIPVLVLGILAALIGLLFVFLGYKELNKTRK